MKISTAFTGSGAKLDPEVAECLLAFCARQLPGVGIPSGVEPAALGVAPINTNPAFPCFFQGGPRSSWGGENYLKIFLSGSVEGRRLGPEAI